MHGLLGQHFQIQASIGAQQETNLQLLVKRLFKPVKHRQLRAGLKWG